MTEYTDVPRANALHQESQQVAQAIASLEAGGTLYSMVVSPPSAPPPPAPGQQMAAPPPMMAVTVMIPPPVAPALLAEVVTWLNDRLVDISAELTELGVTVPPAGSPQWAPTWMHAGVAP
jgi:hypothetical protein